MEWKTITNQRIEFFKDLGCLITDGKPVIEIYSVQEIQLDFCTGTKTGIGAHDLAQIPEERKVLIDAIKKFKK